MAEVLVIALVAVLCAGALYTASAARVIRQYERGVVLRLGRLRDDVRLPGLTLVVPGLDRLRKVNMQIVTMPVPAQDGITRDNVTVRVDAVIYFKVVDPTSAVIAVEDYRFAVSQMAQTSLRAIIGKGAVGELRADRKERCQAQPGAAGRPGRAQAPVAGARPQEIHSASDSRLAGGSCFRSWSSSAGRPALSSHFSFSATAKDAACTTRRLSIAFARASPRSWALLSPP